ncbi:MAG: (Na+)-NQR maturation NqrM [Pseudomonadales bacterium]|jgi:hypothetical protein|nr:(Na+)-NQR maturation NqrM [Pseudomonadales bacterium]
MTTLIVTFVVLAVIFALMSVGVLMGRKPVQGSCGGLNKVDGLGDCEICGGDRNKCDETSSVREQ